MGRVYIFTRFERLWHWIQAVLIIGMLLTGFEIHGSYHLLGFEQAHRVHTMTVWAFIGLWVFAMFWHLTTGEWRQYIPTMKNIDKIVRFYAVGIFKGEPHPFRPTRERKHNPMQAQTYLGVTVVVTPLIWLSGLAYLFYNELGAAGFRVDLGHHRHRAYGGRLPDAGLPDRSHLPRHHRSHAPGPLPGHVHRVG
jgi:thiosulfate reductase cytochrome b subunit